jgi:hypothetical protein
VSLVVYLDASGTAADTPVLAVGGFVATEEQWGEFERAWVAALADEGVAEVHMKELAHWRGEFESWGRDEERRARFLARLTGIMNAHTERSVGVTLCVEEFRAVDADFQLSDRFGGPYAVTSLSVIGSLLAWRDREHPGAPLRFVVERGDNDQGDLYAAMTRIMKRYKDDPLRPLPTVERLPKRWQEGGVTRYRLPFQACDFIAWELRKLSQTVLETGQRLQKPRKSLQQLVVMGKNKLWGYLRTEHLLNLCRTLRIPPRSIEQEYALVLSWWRSKVGQRAEWVGSGFSSAESRSE